MTLTPEQQKRGASLSHKTAIRRKLHSAPSHYLAQRNLLKGRCLDFGCGHGKDAEILDLERYDPHFFPTKPKGKFDTILCTYVLNVVPKDQEAVILKRIKALLSRPHGKAYITVRRDVKKDHLTSKGTLQRRVRLKLPVVKSNSDYCIYLLEAK
jgi:2-polyprenyl-3-methyl-5-hydroxy-6-metoxy-1,4-benzoquinol methylase